MTQQCVLCGRHLKESCQHLSANLEPWHGGTFTSSYCYKALALEKAIPTNVVATGNSTVSLAHPTLSLSPRRVLWLYTDQVTGLETASRGAQPQFTMSLLLTTMFLKVTDFHNAGPTL